MNKSSVIPLFLVLMSSLCNATCQPASSATFKYPPVAAPGYVATPIFGNLSTPRDIQFDDRGTLLVVERGVGVSAYVERNDPTCVGWDRTLVLNNPALTNGIFVEGTEFYVSSMTQVLLYKYNAINLSVSSSFTIVVDQLPSDGDLPARTLLISPARGSVPRSLFVSDGPLANIDPTASDPASGRSQIRRFALPAPHTPYIWPEGGELIAYGIRNGAGLSLGPKLTQNILPPTLWVVENGASLNTIIGNNLSTNNPADELEKVDLRPQGLGKFYGFPYCHTGFDSLPSPWDVTYPGEQFSINSTDSGFGNSFCRDPSNNAAPRLLFQPHSVPLDIKFYDTLLPSRHGLQAGWLRDGFVSFHGSFDRTPPTGYSVVHVPWKADGSAPQGSPNARQAYSILVQPPDLNTCTNSSLCVRPVGLSFDRHGRLFVSSDSTGEIFYISRE